MGGSGVSTDERKTKGQALSGWIKVEKDLRDDPRILRMAKGLRNAQVTQERVSTKMAETLVLGGLVQFWMYADSHIREDNTLDIGIDEIDELVGIVGFAKLIPVDWLEILEEHRVKLPGFQEHNGTEAKKRALTQKRVANYRVRSVTQESSSGVTSSNAPALPDQTRLDQTRPEKKRTAAVPPSVGWFDDFKAIYPRRSGDQGWPKALRAAHARIAEGHDFREFLDGARRYAAYVDAKGDAGTEFVKQAATFLGPDKPFLLPWAPPPSKNQLRQDSNIAVSQEWLEKIDAA